jgi:hypothetical protein
LGEEEGEITVSQSNKFIKLIFTKNTEKLKISKTPIIHTISHSLKSDSVCDPSFAPCANCELLPTFSQMYKQSSEETCTS